MNLKLVLEVKNQNNVNFEYVKMKHFIFFTSGEEEDETVLVWESSTKCLAELL